MQIFTPSGYLRPMVKNNVKLTIAAMTTTTTTTMATIRADIFISFDVSICFYGVFRESANFFFFFVFVLIAKIWKNEYQSSFCVKCQEGLLKCTRILVCVN